MKKKLPINLLFYAILIALLSFSTIAQDPIVVSVSTSYLKDNYLREGSFEGGTLLYIKGTGFDTNKANDRVTIGGLDCPIVEANDIFITCRTVQGINDGVASKVRVFVSDKEAQCSTTCEFTYRSSKSPKLYWLWPRTTHPGEYIFFTGIFKISNTDRITQLKLADSLCDRFDLDNDNLDGYAMNSINCRVSPLMKGGIFLANSRSDEVGDPKKMPFFGSYTINDNPYDFACIPKITKLSTNVGSIKGQIITIEGLGFSNKSPEIEVTAYDIKCDIITSTNNMITCQVQEDKRENPSTFYVGQTGLLREIYNLEGFSESAGTLKTKLETLSLNDPKRPPLLSTSILLDVSSYPMRDNYGQLIRGFFKAPKTGKYKFYIASDDSSQLWFSSVPASLDRNNLVKLAYVNGYTSFRNYIAVSTQISAEIDLTANQYYLMEVYHVEGGGDDHLSVAVEVPSDVEKPNSINEIIQINITYEPIFEQVELRIWGATGGKWKITIADRTSRELSWGESSTGVENAINGDLGYYAASVSRSPLDNNGAPAADAATTAGYLYLVTYKRFRPSQDLPFVDVSKLSGSPKISKAQTVAPSPPIDGTFTMSYKSIVSSDIAYNDDGSQIYKYLTETLKFSPNIIIKYGGYAPGDNKNGRFFQIFFYGVKGDLEDFVFDNTKMKGGPAGTPPKLTLIEIIKGSNNLFFDPIPFDMINTIVDKPQAVVSVNGVRGTCSPNANCNYEIDRIQSLTPEIQNFNVVSSGLTMEISNPGSLVISSSDITVKFAGSECNQVSLTNSLPLSTIICSIEKNNDNTLKLVAGTHKPIIHIRNIGYANYKIGLGDFDVPLVINSISPSTGSEFGGTLITITGSGFSLNFDDLANLMQVKVSSSVWEIISTSNKEVVVKSTPKNGAADLAILVNQKTTTSNLFSYTTAGVPTITSISPITASPVQKGDLRITGTNFGTDKSKLKCLLDKADIKGAYELSVYSVTNTEIVCILGGGRTGEYKVRVVKDPIGASILSTPNADVFKYQFTVTSISPLKGSRYGGTLLTITGTNFSPIKNQNQVFIGNDNILCDIETASATSITCITRPAPDNYVGAQDLVVQQRLAEDGVCTGTCKFEYSAVASVESPEVTSVTISDSGQTAGDIITITGTNLSPSAGSTKKTKIIFGPNNQATVEADTNTDTEIKFTYPALAPGLNYILVLVDNKGLAKIPQEYIFTTIPVLISVTPTTGSQGGGLLTLKGNGFIESTVVAFADANSGLCTILSRSLTEIKCRTEKNVNSDLKVTGTQDQKTLTCNGCAYRSDAAKTPVVTALSTSTITLVSNTFSLTLTGTNLMIDTLSEVSLEILDTVSQNTVKYVGTVSSNTATTLAATFTNVPAGNGYILRILFQNFGYALFNIANKINVTLPLPTSTKVQSSFNGGKKISFTGLGFIINPKNSNLISICGSPCKVITSSFTTLDCEIPPLVTTLSDSTFSLANTDLVTFDVLNDMSVADKTLNDGSTGSTYTCKTANCFAKIVFGEGFYAKIDYIKFYPDLKSTLSLLAGLVIEGSNDDITFTNVKTFREQDLVMGWNYVYPENVVSYKILRFKGNSSTNKLKISEIEIIGKKYQLSTDPLVTISCQADISVNGQSQKIQSAVEYRQDQTPTISSISPSMGSTAGGTTISIQGTGLGTVAGDVSVKIDGVTCVVSSATDTTVTCVTGARSELVPSSLDIRVKDNKAALKGASYLYIDRWSDPNTWGGEQPPREGESAFIPAGQIVLVDISTPVLYSVMIEGGILFEDVKELEFQAHMIVCHMCFFQIGSETNPHINKLTITLFGKKDDKQLPIYGNKGLIVHYGKVDIFGEVRTPTWTLLSITAEKGTSTITLQEQVDWRVGEEIVIAATGWTLLESETRFITAVSVDKKTLTLSRPLDFSHVSVRDTYGDTNQYFIEMRGEVGLLTRNVVFRGDENSQKDLYGAHMMIHGTELDGTRARISYAEFTNTGQQTIVGRYPIHFHLCGEMQNSFVRGNSVHHSLARLVTVHGSRFLRIQKNVGFDIFGHQYFLEDGAETNNIIEDNIAINTKMVWTLIDTDVTAAAYWLTHPYNILRRNRAAGGEWYGFWYELRPNPTGPSVNPNICPEGEVLGEFKDNEAHTFLRYGLRIKTHHPRTFPCKDILNQNVQDIYKDNPTIQTKYTDFISWRNGENGVQIEDMGHIWFENMKIADSKEGGFDIWVANATWEGAAKIKNALIIGISTGNPGSPSDYPRSRGIILPRSNFFTVEDVVFVNFNQGQMTALASCSMCSSVKKIITGGKTTKLKNLAFVNVLNKIFWDGVKRDIFMDLDGTLTGLEPLNSPYYLSPYYPHLLDTAKGCKRDDTATKVFGDAVICPKAGAMREVLFFFPAPGTIFSGVQMKVLRLTGSLDLAQAKESDFTIANQIVTLSGDTAQSWGFPFVTDNTYNLHWGYGIDFGFLPLRASPEWTPNEKIILRFNYTNQREVFDVLVKTGPNIDNVTASASLQLTNQIKYGSNSLDATNKYLYLGVSGNINGSVGVRPVLCRLTCPKAPETEAPKESSIRLWSNASMWPGGRLPLAGETAIILEEWQVILDIDPPSLGELRILGNLIFDESRDISRISSAIIYISRGRLIAGNETNPFLKKIEITITGRRESPGLQIDQYTEGGNKVLAVTGKLYLFGKPKNIVFTRLARFAAAGSSQIEVENNVEGDWLPSEKIVIGPSDFAVGEYEILNIVSVSGNKVTLSSPLKYNHYGDPKTIETHVGTLDMRAAVGILSRNIVIQGSDEGGWGARVLVAKTVEKIGDFNIDRVGEVQFRGVEIRACGHPGSERACVHFQNNPGVPSNESRIIGSAIHSAFGWGVSITSSENVVLMRNTIADAQKFSIQIWKANNFQILRNLFIGVRQRPETVGAALWDHTAAIDMWSAITSKANFLIQENVAQGIDGVGYIFPASVCGENSGFLYNSAGSTIVGWLVSKNGTGCQNMSHFTAYKNEKGVIEFLTVDAVRASNFILAENREGMTVMLGHEGDDNKIEYTNMWIGALVRPNCPECYPDINSCSFMRGLRVPVVAQHGGTIPIVDVSSPKDFIVICTETAFESRAYHRNIKYINFQFTYQNHSVQAWQKCKRNQVFQSFSSSPDASASQILIDTECIGCDEDGLINFAGPSSSWVGWEGGCGNITCTGPNNLLITDISGKFLGRVGQAIPDNPVALSSFCQAKPAWRGYLCEGNEFTILVFESIDANRRNRLYIPVIITTGGAFKNVLNMWREWSWNANLPKDQRLARFWSMILKNRYYEITFPSSLPQDMRFMLQDSTVDSDFVILKIKYEVPNSIQVLVNGKIIQPYLLSENVDLYSKTSICGANIFNAENRTIELVVNRNPDCIVRVRYVDSVKVTMRLETTVDDFYKNNGVASFIDKMAAFLGIEFSRLKIVNIRKGSVIVDFFIDSASSNQEPQQNSNLNNYIDKISEAINSNSLPINYTVIEFKSTTISSSSSNGNNNGTNSNNLNNTLVLIGNKSSVIDLTTAGSESISDSTVIGLVLGVLIPSIALVFLIVAALISKRNKLEVAKILFDETENNQFKIPEGMDVKNPGNPKRGSSTPKPKVFKKRPTEQIDSSVDEQKKLTDNESVMNAKNLEKI